GGGNSDFVNVAAHPGGVVAAFDAKSGEQRWKVGFTDSVLGAIAARDGKVLCPVRNGELVLLNQKDGSVIWRQPLGSNSNLLGAPAGGTAVNLGVLIRAVFPVPGGFVITTEAYRHARSYGSPHMPESLAEEIRKSWRAMGAPAVAVRPSATAEDMAEASMAGQYD